MARIRLVAGFLTVGLWTLLSRVFGFARDVMMAAYLGAGPVTDAFFVAFSLPNMFRRFFAEGAFNFAFVPMFAKKHEAGDDAEGFARDAFWGMAALLLIFSTLAVIAMPFLVWAMAAGFAQDDRFDMAVLFGRVAFPYIFFISLVALLSGMLNAVGRFTAAAAAPVLLNIVFVGAMLLADRAGWPMGLALSWAVPVAGVAQLIALWVAVRRAGFQMRFRMPRLTPELKRLAIIAAPAVLAGGVVQINLIVGRQVASFTDNAVSWLSYADRLYQLPLGVVGIAVGVVLLPELSRRLRAGDEGAGQHSFNRGLEFSLFLTLPSAVALVVIATPIVAVLFGRGAWTVVDTQSTALALGVYALGLPAFVLHKVLQPLYYARHDTRRPFRYAVVSMVVNALVAIGLMPFIGFVAAALATSLAAWVMVWQLWRGSRDMGRAAQLDAQMITRMWRIVLAAALMGVVLHGLHLALSPWLEVSGMRYLALLAMVLGGSAAYFAFGQMVGAFNLSELRASLRRSRGSAPAQPDQ
ncbi:murein biosynthesis integral membrane protein MurJ [Roseinatronobacter sp. S2]|uniref:murein biosynthesis integral membrane protein MurJ n=1 Tax=Roseinatronobacter sp. S2 TaxID=3035471 RepID=UPI00240F4F93|nr:murein biosynthesis integral membrane protein MurJ [Roseinatronobacter sp. S2]WFE73604.1 murein biosynthesis integral membrane protein MurJ [Roseinatronobacter sp. S2]